MTWQCSSKSGTCHSSHTHSHPPLTRETRSLLIERHSRLRVAPPGAALLHGARSLKSSQTFSSWGGLGLGLADWSRDSSVGLAIMLRDDWPRNLGSHSLQIGSEADGYRELFVSGYSRHHRSSSMVDTTWSWPSLPPSADV
jgi:hypothetical protein